MDRPRRQTRPELRILSAIFCLAIGGCNSVPSAGLQTLTAATGLGRGTAPQFAPGVSYLRADWGVGAAYLVLGDLDTSARGPVQVFYSAGRQVLRLQHGRIAGSYGLPVDWPAVTWTELPASWRLADAGALRYVRTRDQAPSHRMGVRENITLRRTPAPARLDLPGIDRAHWERWAWYTEEVAPLRAQESSTQEPPASQGLRGRSGLLLGVSTGEILPPALFAVDLDAPGEPVRFSYQCMSPSFCLRLQPLPPAPAAADR